MTNNNTARKSFFKVKAGDELTIRLFSRGAASSWTERVRVVAVDFADKDDAQVTFESAKDDNAAFGNYEWSIYRFKGRWVYGSSADRVSLEEIH